jgi:hypothetical protein
LPKFRVNEVRCVRTVYEMEAENEIVASAKFPDGAEVVEDGDGWLERIDFEEVEEEDE